MWRVEFFKIGKRDFTFIREMRVHTAYAEVWIKLLRIFELGLNFDLIFVESGAEPKTASAAQQRASCTR